jgi:Holliday junction DNA helicase RuvA
MLVSEDSIRLMGFATADERDWFRLLTSVQGVGAKVALAILSILSARGSADRGGARRFGDDRPGQWRRAQARPAHRQRTEGQGRRHRAGRRRGGAAPAGGAAADAVSAMLNLGFKPAEASAAVGAAADELGAGATLDALVRLALRKAAK